MEKKKVKNLQELLSLWFHRHFQHNCLVFCIFFFVYRLEWSQVGQMQHSCQGMIRRGVVVVVWSRVSQGRSDSVLSTVEHFFPEDRECRTWAWHPVAIFAFSSASTTFTLQRHCIPDPFGGGPAPVENTLKPPEVLLVVSSEKFSSLSSACFWARTSARLAFSASFILPSSSATSIFFCPSLKSETDSSKVPAIVSKSQLFKSGLGVGSTCFPVSFSFSVFETW